MYGTLGGVLSIGLLVAAVGWLFGNVMGKWGLKILNFYLTEYLRGFSIQETLSYSQKKAVILL